MHCIQCRLGCACLERDARLQHGTLQHTLQHCNIATHAVTLHHTRAFYLRETHGGNIAHCNTATLQHTPQHYIIPAPVEGDTWLQHCTLQHTLQHCNTHCNTTPHPRLSRKTHGGNIAHCNTYCNTAKHTATLQHILQHCNIPAPAE